MTQNSDEAIDLIEILDILSSEITTKDFNPFERAYSIYFL